jgi:hypothetical protein
MTPFFQNNRIFQQNLLKNSNWDCLQDPFFKNNRILQQNLLKKSNWDCLQHSSSFFFKIIEYFSKNLFDYQ